MARKKHKQNVFSSERSYTDLAILIEKHSKLESYQWLKVALKYFGTTEIAGLKSNPLIAQFIATTTGRTYQTWGKEGKFMEVNAKTHLPLVCSIGFDFSRLTKKGRKGRHLDDEVIHWCSAFVNHVMINSGYDGTNSLGARSWRRWGKAIKKKDIKEHIGAIAVFSRASENNPNAGHVGFYLGEEGAHYLILGGNQRNSVQRDSVCVKKYGKWRLLGFRWPK